MSRFFDFPDGSIEGQTNFKNDESAILVIDENRNVYKPQREHDGIVYVQKYLVRKGQYTREALHYIDDAGKEQLTAHPTKSNAFLVKETNFQDIGGGLQTFERHYATFPTTWYEFEEVSYQTAYYGVINYRGRSGEGADWSISRKVLAQATHYYFKKSDVPTTRVPDTKTAGTQFVDDFTRFYNIPPQSTLGRNWENYTPEETLKISVIAPDKIVPYMGEIYELTRYTIQF